jgi:hypothetical protein
MTANGATAKLPSPLIAAIEVVMSKAFHADARIRNISRLTNARSSREERSFWKADVAFGRAVNAVGASEARSLTVLIKCTSGRRRSTEVDQYLSHRNLPVPDFYGAT